MRGPSTCPACMLYQSEAESQQIMLSMQSKEEMGGTGSTDLKAAAQGLRLPSPNTALAPPPSAFQAPRNEDWRSKFRSSDSFTSDRGTPVCCCSLCIAVVFAVGIRCLGFAVSAECVFCFWHSAVGFRCGVASDAHTSQNLLFVPYGCQSADVCMSLHLVWFILIILV